MLNKVFCGAVMKFRPHHFMCTLGFQGKGYSPHFVDNYLGVKKEILENPDSPIEVISGLDSICMACPNKRQNNTCEKQSFIQRLDDNHSKLLNIKVGDKISWNETRLIVKKNVTISNFKSSCKGCGWLNLGICEKAIREI